MTDTEPFWKRPLPPIKVASHVNGNDDPLAEEMSLAEPLSEDITDPVDTDPLADDPLAEPEARPPLADASVSLPDAVAKAAETLVMAPPPTLSVADLQRRMVESQMRCARATDEQRECRGRVALALEKFQRATMQTQTQEQLIRQHIESENQLRADRAAGKIAPRGGQRRLGSAIDAYAFYTKASGRGAGGGAAFRRGASPASRRTPPAQSSVGDIAAPKAFPGSGLPQIKE